MIHLLVSLKQSGLWSFLPFWEIPISPVYPILTATQNGGIRNFPSGRFPLFDIFEKIFWKQLPKDAPELLDIFSTARIA